MEDQSINIHIYIYFIYLPSVASAKNHNDTTQIRNCIYMFYKHTKLASSSIYLASAFL